MKRKIPPHQKRKTNQFSMLKNEKDKINSKKKHCLVSKTPSEVMPLPTLLLHPKLAACIESSNAYCYTYTNEFGCHDELKTYKSQRKSCESQ